MTAMISAFETFARRWRPKIDAALNAATVDLDVPKTLKEAIRYSLLLPGKRVRPLLTLMAADACGADAQKAMPVACAIEMVHAFSLIHDDLPAMDNDDLRRGKPTNHKVFGEAQALLAGDALLTLAFDALHPLGSVIATMCMKELSTACMQMIGGQSNDMQGVGADAAIDRVEKLHTMKTGALIVCALRMGAIVAQANHRQIDVFSVYGENLGLAFQITDDLLDATADASTTGKKTRKDSEQGKGTHVTILGVKGAKKRAQECIDAATGALEIFGTTVEHLKGLAEFVLSRDR